MADARDLDRTGATARGLARGRVGAGGSSYDWLAAAIPATARAIVDLGCGNGYLLKRLAVARPPAVRLIGIDRDRAELAAARRRPVLAGVELLAADAAVLPLRDGCADAVVSHLAFTLMSDLDVVVAEIARVVAPGGTFATVVGGGPRVGDAAERFVDALSATARAAGIALPALGDRRARTEPGLRALFSPATGFAAPTIDDDYLTLDGRPDAVWRSMTLSSLELAALPPAALADLHVRFTGQTADLLRPDGTLPCALWVRRVVAVRR